MSDSEQNKFEVQAMQILTDANAEYLTANQDIIQDYSYFDTWYLNYESNPDVANYYAENFSEPLIAAMNGDEYPFSEEYYTAMYAGPNEMFDESDRLFNIGAQWDERGDQLQLVMMIMAIGLTFAAWASLLKEESRMRVLFSIFATLMFIYGLILYMGVPTVA